MHNQREFKARIRPRNANSGALAQLHGLLKLRMFIAVEHRPHLILPLERVLATPTAGSGSDCNRLKPERMITRLTISCLIIRLVLFRNRDSYCTALVAASIRHSDLLSSVHDGARGARREFGARAGRCRPPKVRSGLLSARA